MCSPATCPTCKKATYSGCGNHVEAVLGHVPRRPAVCLPADARAASGWFRYYDAPGQGVTGGPSVARVAE